MATKKKKKKKEFDIGPMPAEPQPRDFGEEFEKILPMLGELGGMGSEQYIKSQKELTEYQYDFFKQHYPEVAAMEREQQRESTRLTREDALNWAWQRGPNAMAVARANNPAFAASYDKLTGMVGEAGTRSPFAAELDRQAMGELKLGGALSPEEERQAQQSARTAYAARGQVGGNPASVAEVLNRDSMSRARLRERQGIAAGREQTFEAQRGAERQFVGGAMQLTEAVDPTYKYLGMSSGATQPGTLMGFTQGVRTPDPSSVYSAGLGYAGDLFNTNLNMQASMYNSWQNNSAALQAAKMQSQAQIQSAQAQAGAMGGGGGSGMGGALIGAGGAVIGAAIPAVLAAF